MVALEVLAASEQPRESWSSFAAFLNEREDLFALVFKQAVSHAILRLLVDGRPIQRPVLEMLIRFFSWDDYATQRLLIRQGMDLQVVYDQLIVAEMNHWMKDSPRDATVRQLDAVRKAGAGIKAWWMAKRAKGRRAAVDAILFAQRRFGVPATRKVLGESTMVFWMRTTSDQPNWVQFWQRVPVLTMLCFALVTLLLWSIAPPGEGLDPTVVGLLWIPVIFLFLVGMNDFGERLFDQRINPRILAGTTRFLQATHLDRVPVVLWPLAGIGLLVILSVYWPPSLSDRWYYTLYLVFLPRVFAHRVIVITCIPAVAAVAGLMSTAHVSARPSFVLIPLILFLGRRGYRLSRRWKAAAQWTEAGVTLTAGAIASFLIFISVAYLLR